MSINTQEMKRNALNQKAGKTVMFSMALAVVIVLTFLLAFSLKENNGNPVNETTVNKGNEQAVLKLLSVNEKLQQQLAVIQQLDVQYAGSLSDTSFSATTDSIGQLILLEENNLRNAITVAEVEGSEWKDTSLTTHIEKMLTAYRRLMGNRKAAAALRNMASIKSTGLAPDEKQLLNLQNEVLEKSSRIASLEMALSQMKNTQQQAPVNNDNIAGLMQNVAALENKILSLTTQNNGLQQENERLHKTQADMSRSAGSVEQSLKEKNMVLQQRIDDLAAEIQLVKVDCNLSRVDATQIISNARQRKQLLNEASEILTNLSASGNTDVNRKAKEKIKKLNQVAGTFRE